MGSTLALTKVCLMQFVTMDFNLADRFLKSPYCISAISWTDGEIDDIYCSFVSPECDIEDTLIEKNHITYDLSNAPVLADIWPDICKIIQEKTVFFPTGTGNVSDLIERLAVDYLTIPDIDYASFFSMVSRVWPELSKKIINSWPKKYSELKNTSEDVIKTMTVKEYNFTVVADYFQMNSRLYNNLNNPLNMGAIINKALKKTNAKDTDRLFEICGYAGGIVTGGRKFHYRSVKEKKSGEYYRHFSDAFLYN